MLTVGMFTARDGYCMPGKPSVHIFDYLIDSLLLQTYKEFELVIADALYEQRKDYFKYKKYPFEIRHVPMKKNLWLDNGYVAISASRNTCLMHARGDSVMLIGDAVALNPDCIENAVKLFDEYDATYMAFDNYNGNELECHGITVDKEPGLGHCGLTAKIEWFEKMNGYDEFYDGSRGWEDSEIVHRMSKAGAKIGFNRTVMNFQKHVPSRIITKKACCLRQKEDIIRARWAEGITPNTMVLRDHEKFWEKPCKGFDNGFCTIVKEPCSYPYDENVKFYLDKSMEFNLKEQRNACKLS